MKTHRTIGNVKALDARSGAVTFAHEPVMSFSVKDKMLFDKLADGKKVKLEFIQEGKNSVVTGVK